MGTVPPSLRLDLDDVGIGDSGAVNVLVLLPAMDIRDDIACAELSGHAPVENLDFLVVALDQSPDERLTVWRTHVNCDLPAKTGVVNVDDVDRSAAARSDGGPTPVPIERITDPSNLTELGIRTSDFLAEWSEDGNETSLCFHSLTALLDAVDTPRAFRFLQVLQGRLEGSNVLAHYHLDPSAHDAETINTVRQTMDVVIEADEDGWQITHR